MKATTKKVAFLYPKVMKQQKIPFKLGMEYENWEFELDLCTNRFEYFDSYKYVGTGLNKFLNKYTDETELLFNLDILEAVIIIFKDKNLHFYENINTLRARFTSKLKYCFCLEGFTKFDIQTLCFYKDRNVFIIYSKKSLIKELAKSI